MKLLFVLLGASFFAMSSQAMGQKKIQVSSVTEQQVELAKQVTVTCSLVSVQSNQVDGGSYVPAKPTKVIIAPRVDGSGTNLFVTIPVNADGSQELHWEAFTVDEKTLVAFDENQIKIDVDLGYGEMTLDINLKTGAGAYTLKADYGGPHRRQHDKSNAIFSDCKKINFKLD